MQIGNCKFKFDYIPFIDFVQWTLNWNFKLKWLANTKLKLQPTLDNINYRLI